MFVECCLNKLYWKHKAIFHIGTFSDKLSYSNDAYALLQVGILLSNNRHLGRRMQVLTNLATRPTVMERDTKCYQTPPSHLSCAHGSRCCQNYWLTLSGQPIEARRSHTKQHISPNPWAQSEHPRTLCDRRRDAKALEQFPQIRRCPTFQFTLPWRS